MSSSEYSGTSFVHSSTRSTWEYSKPPMKVDAYDGLPEVDRARKTTMLLRGIICAAS
jgi:hypothetical protein